MKCVALALLAGCLMLSPVMADDAKSQQPATSAAAEKLKANPDDQAAWTAYMNETIRALFPLTQSDPDAAEKKLAEMKAVLDSLKPEQQVGKTNLTRAQTTVRTLRDNIALSRTSLADLEAKLDTNAADTATLSLYVRKVTSTIAPLVRSEPDKAEALLKAARARLEKGAAGATDETAKQTIENLGRTFANYDRMIESGKKMLALIGKDAAPLEVEAWVNGEPLTDADLKGKVVLLDFWAVWCGPCIATFPHLREWQEKYGEKGLVIIGLTRYYNYAWDADKNVAKRSQEPVAPEAEQEMLKKFASLHNLHHRFAVQSASAKTADYYGVTGIPHVVVIDQTGKIRLMRVGSGEENAKAIGNMLEQLLTSAPAGGGK